MYQNNFHQLKVKWSEQLVCVEANVVLCHLGIVSELSKHT